LVRPETRTCAAAADTQAEPIALAESRRHIGGARVDGVLPGRIIPPRRGGYLWSFSGNFSKPIFQGILEALLMASLKYSSPSLSHPHVPTSAAKAAVSSMTSFSSMRCLYFLGVGRVVLPHAAKTATT